ncbi:hypothetical protein VTK56DRAFT_3095 [Thermocarpiscus australiensis]
MTKQNKFNFKSKKTRKLSGLESFWNAITLKLTAIAAIALASASTVSAWRVYLYTNTDFDGSYYTAAGPGNPGYACHAIPAEHRWKANFIEYYAYNRQSNPTTRCKPQLWDRTGCTGLSGPFYSVDTKKTLPEDWRNRESGFSTDCWSV